MASILQVEQIQGPTSGANANTITIPSGQTLDTSAATLAGLTSSEMPSGTIVQVSTTVNRASASTTGTTFINSGTYVDFTPKFANSVIIVHAQGHIYRNGDGHNYCRVINQSSGTPSGNRGGRDVGGPYHESIPIVWRDTSHNSTTSRRYELQFANRDGGGAQTLYWNDGGGYESGLTVFEVIS